MRPAAFALILAACAPTAASSSAEPPRLTVSRGKLEQRALLTGELAAVTSEPLMVPRSQEWMVALRWLVSDGTRVEAGDKVAEFDTTSLANALSDKKLAVERARMDVEAEVAKASGTAAEKEMEVERRRAALTKAEIEAQVPPDLYPRRVYQDKQAALARERDALVKAEDELATARKTITLERRMKELELARATRGLSEVEQRLEQLVLRAPRAGLVQLGTNPREGRKFQVGDQAYAGYAVATIPDLGVMQVRASLPDVDDERVQVGMKAECTLDAYPDRSFTGSVASRSPVAQPEGRDGIRRSFPVIIALDRTDSTIMLPGMSVRVEVATETRADGLLVPRAALAQVGGAVGVRLTDGRTVKVEVQVCDEHVCAISEPTTLKPGDALLPAVEGA